MAQGRNTPLRNLVQSGKKVSDLANILDSPVGTVYYVDTELGSTTGDGRTPETALKTVEAAYALCVTNRHDVVAFIARATADNPAAAITWSKSYTHLIGIGSDLPGLGNRCRIVTTATVAVTPVITVSGNGCIFKNIQFNQEKATGAASGVAIVTGSRNYFENVFFMAPTSATAASYSLKVGGSENVFKRCTIGQFTNFRSEASYGAWLYGPTVVSRNKFIECEFLSWQGGAGSPHAHIMIDSGITVQPWVTWIEDCLFHCNYAGGTIQAQAIDDNSTAAGHQLVFRGRNNLVVGATLVADTLTYMFAPNPDPNVSGLLAVTVAES